MTMNVSATSAEDVEVRKDTPKRDFAYFNTFDEIATWSEDNFDPIQVSNTPLFRRPDESDRRTCGKATAGRRSNVMLIHDYAGGYNDYESCQGTTVQREDYSCRYLQHVETFVYFSHRMVTIPPATWTNTCHRQGVKVLGTFILEPGSLQAERLLEDVNGSFWVAEKLAQIAKCYGFDGWIINVETAFSVLRFSRDRLERFLRQLRRELGNESKVVWYDALTILNVVYHQDSLNYLNLPFALAAGSMLTNYAWTPQLAQASKLLATRSGLGVENLYFGIDVWAQNTCRDKRHPRVTWPYPGGGGTGTGLGMQALTQVDSSDGSHTLSTGIFAPGWTYEHFPEQNEGVDMSMWLGKYLPMNLLCDCNADNQHSSVPYQQHGIIKFASQALCGTDTFFHTDFRPAFTRNVTNGELFAHLGAQDYIPMKPSTRLVTADPRSFGARLSVESQDFPSRLVVKIQIERGEPAVTSFASVSLMLAAMNILNAGRSSVSLTYRLLAPQHGRVCFSVGPGVAGCTFALQPGAGEVQTLTRTVDHRGGRPIMDATLSFECQDVSTLPVGTWELVELLALTVQPYIVTKPKCDVSDIRLERRGDEDSHHHRLIWSIAGDNDGNKVEGMPYSQTTGPCAYFVVSLNGEEIGRAYALEFVLAEDVVQKYAQKTGADVQVISVGFDGATIGRSKAKLSWPDEEVDGWILVSTLAEDNQY